MAIEQTKVGEVAARMMEALDQHGYSADAEGTDVMLIGPLDTKPRHGPTRRDRAAYMA